MEQEDPIESPTKKDDIEEAVDTTEQPPEEKYTVEDLQNAVRFGTRTHVGFILQKDPSLVNKFDSLGFTCVHWAAKRGELDILCQLQECGAALDTSASFDTQMRPIHWAASDGKLKSVKFLLDNRQDINAQDGNGCSPVIIAAQYGRTEMIVYLVKNGADMNQRDVNGDTALHWAAYKGFEEVTGVLMHLTPQFKDLPDNFGQTPLHLAALRGNVEVVEYMVAICQANTTIRDKNGCTPLMLAMKKEQLKTEWVLRRLTSTSTWDLVSNMGLSRLKNKMILGYLFVGCGDAELGMWIWRVSFLSNFMASYAIIGYSTSAVLGDYPTLHLINTMLHLVWWGLFIMCLIKSPGFVPDEVAHLNSIRGATTSGKSGSGKGLIGGFHPQSYDAALVLMGSDLAVQDGGAARLPAVCHTCHVQKPSRSKHCKVARKCVCKFDHFCPFIYNTVGRDNYKYFMSILVVHPIAYLFFLYTTLCYWYRAPLTWMFSFFLLYSFLMFVAIGGLGAYHMRLISRNLTTNEEINLQRYAYFRNEFNAYNNPFCKGSKMANFVDGMFPSSRLYYSRDEAKRDTEDDVDGDIGHEHEGFFEEAESKLLQ